jgi:segregation and condensation protein A
VRAAGATASAAGNGSSARPSSGEGEGYRVRLEQFEGPLDLLLHLIKAEEVDICDIPIARITDQFLESIRDLESLDLDRAGEYLLMAATLMRIKSKMLLPSEPGEEEEEEEDPRTELVRRLLEYREFQRVAEVLREREESWRGIFHRTAAPLLEEEAAEVGDLGVSLVDLFRAFRDVLERLERERPLEVETEEYSLEEQMEFIRRRCAGAAEGVAFGALFEGPCTRPLVITTFLALLELMRLREVLARQAEPFGEIWISLSTKATTHEL